MIRVYENIGMQNQNVFKIIEVINTDKFRDFVSGFDEYTLANDVCHAINDAVGNAIVAEITDNDKKIVIKINGKSITIKDHIDDCVSDNPSSLNYNQTCKIEEYIAEKCNLEWIDDEHDALPK